MLKQIYKNNLSIHYRIEGSGLSVILLHGFLETLQIWADFSNELSKHFKIITIDLPGHGNSDLFKEPFHMEKYAESVYHVVLEENIDKAFLIGHSMGGYVALACAGIFNDKLNGLCLFHSSPFSDSAEKKTARFKTMDSIDKGNLKEIIAQHFINVYAEDNVSMFKKEIDLACELAGKLTENAVKASIKTMADRNDSSEIVSGLKIPFLLIAGKKDKLIPVNIINQIKLPLISKICILENSGHMGMIEEKDKALKVIKEFIEKNSLL
jgi:pimeloyl-ACP methyl ester carboxylesterase